jgi:hypothetical protein
MRKLDGRRSSRCGECEKRGLRATDLLNFEEPETHDYRDQEPERNQNGAEQAGCGWRPRSEKERRDAQQNNRVSHARDTLHLLDTTTLNRYGIIVPTPNSRTYQSETIFRVVEIAALNLSVFPHVVPRGPALALHNSPAGNKT